MLLASASSGLITGIAMTRDAVLELLDSFFQVLRSNLLRRMLVTAVTGVLAVVVVRMADAALDVVIPVELEVSVVIEGSRLPALL